MELISSGDVYHPKRFFSLTFFFSWILFFAAAYSSHHNTSESIIYLFFSLAVMTPALVTFYMIWGSGNPALKKDFWGRLLGLRLLRLKFVLFAIALMPVTIIAATLLSIPAGESSEQFRLSSAFFTLNDSPVLVLLVAMLFAPTFEEIAWKGYGIDSLLSQGGSVFNATMRFGVLWTIWHLPLFFIKNYYHYSVMQANVWFGLNIILSILPIAFLSSWLFFKSDRSILIAILFHAAINISMSVLNTGQIAKCFVTLILYVIIVALIVSDRPFWLENHRGDNAVRS
ncbi:MAG: hypothetical protein CSYNP_02561 [Syntrophus sp. SKADARSKE-3]|nr:hypothetical protein [Syntrophus sp. SKADARSKE-3]